jgi:hypothetical protein
MGGFELKECWRLEHLGGETTPTCTSPKRPIRHNGPFSSSIRRLPSLGGAIRPWRDSRRATGSRCMMDLIFFHIIPIWKRDI